MKRASGVLMPIFSLPSNYSVGSFGEEAFWFIDFLAANGFTYWQVLPFGVTDSFHSPYQSYSAFSGNPYFIDLPTLAEQGLITKEELMNATQKSPYLCEYDRLESERLVLLKKASLRVSAQEKEKIEQWANDTEVMHYARFMALKEKNNGTCWNEWVDLAPDPQTVFLWQFIEYHFQAQWKMVLDYAHTKNISIIGDLPIYVSYDSCDVWSHPDQFLLDEKGYPTHVAGCPPDYFAKEGQLWGNPLYHWDKMKADDFAWWKERMAYQMQLFDGVRLDHFRGFESFWAVPFGSKTAVNGQWIKGPGMDFVRAMKQVAGEKLIIAEDLGDITPEVEQLVKDSEFPGMRVFQFAFLGGNNPHLPHNYIQNCVAYSGTHDNNTLLGYLWELDDATRQTMLSYCGFKGNDWGIGWRDVLRVMMASAADLVIFPIQDLLGYGADTRVNKPGIANENWQVRFTKEQIASIDQTYIKDLHRLYFR
ncbi:MAG: 4-alpha-glucanotransferase [Clostridia bacterium]|nr:4-alpha-glucanotransferase [Clostridia bacterium]